MIASLVYRVVGKLLAVLAVLLRRNMAKDAELLVLRHENAVLRRHLTSPVRYEPTDRLWCAALSSLILRRRWALVFLEHSTRRLHIAGVTAHPTGSWTLQQARNLAVELGSRVDSLCFLLRDRDAQDTESFDAVFAADDLRIVRTAPRAPRMNAPCERIIGTLRREALDHLLIWNERHARQALDSYARRYNGHRPHQARGQLPPLARVHPTPMVTPSAHRLLRTRILGSVINEYRYAA